MLKESEETLFSQPLPPERAERLKVVKEGCDKVLVDLQSLVSKYESLGTQSKRTWDRMGWGNEDIADIRARLTSNISILAAFISTSQTSVETKLDKFIEEFRQGKRETSVVSTQTVDSLSADDKAIWRNIRKELEEIGISVAAFEANRNFIFDWFVRAVETGAFDEHNADVDDSTSKSSASRGSPRIEDDDGRGKKQQLDSHNAKAYSPEELFQSLASQQRTPRKTVPRVAALLAGLSRPRRRLIKAVAKKENSKALKILKDEASFQLLDLGKLNQALLAACCHDSGSNHLIAELIARGCDVNYISNDYTKRTPLLNSVANGSFNVVKLLIENGADINCITSNGIDSDNFAPRAALSKYPRILRLLLSSGVDVNARYRVLDRDFRIMPESTESEVNLIHEAVSLRAIPAMEALLEHGADIDIFSADLGTALMLALFYGEEDVARFLLANGADPNIEADSNLVYGKLNGVGYRNPIEAAILSGRSSMVRLLLDKGVVPDDSTLKYAKKANVPLPEPFAFDQPSAIGLGVEIIRILEDVLQKPESQKRDQQLLEGRKGVLAHR